LMQVAEAVEQGGQALPKQAKRSGASPGPMAGMDVMLQSGHQSHTHRLVLYHQGRDHLPVFPSEGYGEEAVELGPRTNKKGPCLTLLRNVTAKPEEFLEWFSTSLMGTGKNVNRIYFFDKPEQVVSTREELLKKLIGSGAPKDTIRMQCNPRELQQWLGDNLPEDFKLDPKSHEQVLNAVEADGKIWYSLHPASWLFLNPSQSVKNSAHSCSKAHNKLEEALYVAGTTIHGRKDWCALDIGAAPGAWTGILADQCRLVIAVDPAELSDFAKRENVVHLRQRSEDCTDKIQELSKPTGGVDVLVCDMNKHPGIMADVIKSLIPLLKSGALMVMTFKFFGTGRDRADDLTTFLEQVGPGIHGCEYVWLLANTIHERTLLAWRD